MRTNISPVNPTRSEKLEGRRVRCVVYLSKEDAAQIEAERKKTGISQSGIIARYYALGKNNNLKQEV